MRLQVFLEGEGQLGSLRVGFQVATELEIAQAFGVAQGWVLGKGRVQKTSRIEKSRGAEIVLVRGAEIEHGRGR